MMKQFPLPSLTQDQYSTYYGKVIPREDKVEEKIVYPGIKLTCPAKYRNLKKVIKPKHVFITKIHDTYNHRIYGSDNQWSILPKRLHSLCFPKIHLGSIPKNNRIVIQITDTIHQELPYIPDEFYKQKIQKAEKPSKPVTRRNKRQRTNNQNKIKHDENYEGWKQEGINTQGSNTIGKKELMQHLKYTMDEIHKQKLVVKHPFENIQNIHESDEAKEKFLIITQFIYHYTKEEMRMQPTIETNEKNIVWENIKELFN